MQVVRFNVGPLDNNTYLLIEETGGACAVVDPAFESRVVLEAIQQRGLRTEWILNTHCHLDHVVENAFFVEQTGAPFAMPEAEVGLYAELPQWARWFGCETPRQVKPHRLLADGDSVAIGSETLRVAIIGGHSPGCACLLGEGFAIVGDVIFRESIGRTDFPGGSLETLTRGIHERLFTLPDATVLYPGHGPETTVGHEKRWNPYVGLRG